MNVLQRLIHPGRLLSVCSRVRASGRSGKNGGNPRRHNRSLINIYYLKNVVNSIFLPKLFKKRLSGAHLIIFLFVRAYIQSAGKRRDRRVHVEDIHFAGANRRLGALRRYGVHNLSLIHIYFVEVAKCALEIRGYIW